MSLISMGDRVGMRGLFGDSIIDSMKSTRASWGVLTTFLTLPVMGAIRSGSVMGINMAAIANLSSSLTTSKESEW